MPASSSSKSRSLCGSSSQSLRLYIPVLYMKMSPVTSQSTVATCLMQLSFQHASCLIELFVSGKVSLENLMFIKALGVTTLPKARRFEAASGRARAARAVSRPGRPAAPGLPCKWEYIQGTFRTLSLGYTRIEESVSALSHVNAIQGCLLRVIRFWAAWVPFHRCILLGGVSSR